MSAKRTSDHENLDAVIAAIEASGHSVFAPSSAHRWFECPASLRAGLLAHAALIDEDGTPLNADTVWSVEGSAAHMLAETWLASGVIPAHLIGETFTRGEIEIVIDEEMLGYVGEYVRWCQDLPTTPWFGVESRVDISRLFPLATKGTADFWHYDEETRTLTITDLKYGQGVQVFAELNHQLMLYALGVLWLLKIWLKDVESQVERVVLRIAQPRLEHFDTWETDVIELHHFAHETRLRAKEAWSDDAPFNPHPKACRFCAVRKNCRALATSLEDMADAAFTGDDEPTLSALPREGLSTEEQDRVLTWKPTIAAWLKAIELDLLEKAEGGEDLTHFKIVEGRARRGWKNESKAKAYLEMLGLDENDMYEKSMISPAGAERLARAKLGLSKKVLGPVVDVSHGPRTLAPKVDPRGALAGLASAFDPEDDTDLS